MDLDITNICDIEDVKKCLSLLQVLNLIKNKTVMEPTKNQKIKYFGASDPEKKKNRSIEERVNEFLVQDSINVMGLQ